MKTTYWLVTVAAVTAAGVTVYTRITAGDPPPPKVPAVTEAPRESPYLALPPVVMPPDEPAAPVGPETPAAPMPLPELKPESAAPPAPRVPVPTIPTVPPMTSGAVVPASGIVPITPFVPIVPPSRAPAQPQAAVEIPPYEAAKTPAQPEKPESSSTPTPPAKSASLIVPPPPPVPVPPPTGPTPVLQPPVPARPQPLPASTPVGDAEPLAVVGKYVVLKDDKLIEGAVSVNNDIVVVRQGALDRPFTKGQVQYVAASRDEVYRFMREKVPASDAVARLKVARWCMFSGLREQALTEAREVRKLQPANRAAADMVRSLELSLQQFPAEDSAKMVAPTAPTFPTELKSAPVPPIPPAAAVDPEPDVTPEAALVFASRVQPFLANQCVDCHAKPDFTGKFKLVRVAPQDAGPQATRTNLRAVAGQLRKDDPAASPLLMKALSAHGGMKLPAIASRQAAAYLGLEGWVAVAVGTPVAATPAPPVPPVSPTSPTPPISPVAPPSADPIPPLPNPPAPPVSPLPLIDPAPLPNPPVPAVPAVPLPNPPVTPALPTPRLPAVPSAPAPLLPPAVPMVPPAPAPAPLPKPVVPAIPPAENFSPIVPPVPKPIAPADTTVKPPVPAIPPIPPAASAPKLPSGVQPASGSQFGAANPPKPPVTGPAGDEFDPSGFNQQPRK